jgi:hypothetical protein
MSGQRTVVFDDGLVRTCPSSYAMPDWWSVVIGPSRECCYDCRPQYYLTVVSSTVLLEPRISGLKK